MSWNLNDVFAGIQEDTPEPPPAVSTTPATEPDPPAPSPSPSPSPSAEPAAAGVEDKPPAAPEPAPAPAEGRADTRIRKLVDERNGLSAELTQLRADLAAEKEQRKQETAAHQEPAKGKDWLSGLDGPAEPAATTTATEQRVEALEAFVARKQLELEVTEAQTRHPDVPSRALYRAVAEAGDKADSVVLEHVAEALEAQVAEALTDAKDVPAKVLYAALADGKPLPAVIAGYRKLAEELRKGWVPAPAAPANGAGQEPAKVDQAGIARAKGIPGSAVHAPARKPLVGKLKDVFAAITENSTRSS